MIVLRPWVVTSVLLLAAGLGSACGKSGGGTGGGSGGGSGGAGGGTISDADVNGSEVDSYYPKGGGFQAKPVDLSGTTIVAWSPLPDGGFGNFPGTGDVNGRFHIPAVPSGPYYLRVGSWLIYTTARVLQLGDELLGRANVRLADAGTGLSLTMTNLAPWTPDDDLQLVSWNAGIGYFSTASQYGPITANAPNPNDTGLTGTQLDFGDVTFPLIEANQADDFTLAQLSGRTTDAGIRIQEATRGFSSTTLAMTQGAYQPLSGAFTALDQTAATIDLRFGDFTALANSVHPQAVPGTGYFFLDLNPGPLTQRLSAGNPDLVAATLPASTPNLVFPVSYGNPYSSKWTPYLYVSASFDLAYSIRLPDGGVSTPRTESASVIVAQAAGAGPIGPIAVQQSPARALTIDGMNATGAALANVSTTPEISWTAPAIGVPTSYGLRIAQLTPSATGGTRRTFLFNLTLPGDLTRIRLPPGLLVPRADYFLRLTAYADPAPFDPARPFKSSGFPYASAQLLSSSFQTQ